MQVVLSDAKINESPCKTLQIILKKNNILEERKGFR